MKKIITILLMFLCVITSGYAQDFTERYNKYTKDIEIKSNHYINVAYKKYNRITKQYDLYNKQHQKIGYQKYNKYLKQWEYHIKK